MKKAALLVLLVSFVSLFPLSADDFTVEGAEPYNTKATPQWLKDLRRGEIITLGSWPFTLLLTSLGYSLIQVGAHNFDFGYMRNPFSTVGGDYSERETLGLIFTSLGISVGVGVADFIVAIVKRKKAEKNAISHQMENVILTPLEGGNALLFQERNSEIIFGNLESAVF